LQERNTPGKKWDQNSCPKAQACPLQSTQLGQWTPEGRNGDPEALFLQLKAQAVQTEALGGETLFSLGYERKLEFEALDSMWSFFILLQQRSELWDQRFSQRLGKRPSSAWSPTVQPVRAPPLHLISGFLHKCALRTVPDQA
jgi:hypothetical protein